MDALIYPAMVVAGVVAIVVGNVWYERRRARMTPEEREEEDRAWREDRHV